MLVTTNAFWAKLTKGHSCCFNPKIIGVEEDMEKAHQTCLAKLMAQLSGKRIEAHQSTIKAQTEQTETSSRENPHSITGEIHYDQEMDLRCTKKKKTFFSCTPSPCTFSRLNVIHNEEAADIA